MVSARAAIFSLGLNDELLRQITVGDGGHDLGDPSHLTGEVRGHLVDVVSQVFPCARDALDVGLATEPALGTDFLGDASDLRREGPQLLDHRVDRALELENLAFGLDRNVPGQVPVGDGGRDKRDVADLVGQVPGEQVDVVGQLSPRS